MGDIDELYTLRNYFWIGAYQTAIDEASGLRKLPDHVRIEKEEYVYRSLIGLGEYEQVLSSIPQEGSHISHSAISLLANYKSNPQENKELVFITLQEWLNDTQAANNATLQLCAAMIYLEEGQIKEALRCIRYGTSMEQLALSVQIYLKLDRLDYANKTLKLMQNADEDSTLTQLCNSWINLSTGGPKLQEALYSYQELIDKFCETTMLLNGLAVTNIHLGHYDKAEGILIKAMNRDQTNPDTIINYIACLQHLNKSVEKLMIQLKNVAPLHPYLQSLNTLEMAFDRISQQYAI